MQAIPCLTGLSGSEWWCSCWQFPVLLWLAAGLLLSVAQLEFCHCFDNVCYCGVSLLGMRLGVIMHRCRHGKTPQYFVDCCTPITDVIGRQHLRSATQQLMVVPRCRLSTVGCRAFAVHSPVVWNSLPDDHRTQQDYESFRQGLKSWLFSRY